MKVSACTYLINVNANFDQLYNSHGPRNSGVFHYFHDSTSFG
jgi:hypothetical protein